MHTSNRHSRREYVHRFSSRFVFATFPLCTVSFLFVCRNDGKEYFVSMDEKSLNYMRI